MTERADVTWPLVHRLAAELALNRVSKNLVQNVVVYLRTYPETPLLDYATHMEQLSVEGYFQAGKSGPYERVDFFKAVQRVDLSGVDPARHLAWVARLIEYYTRHKPEAVTKSGLGLRAPRRGELLDGMVRETDRRNTWVQITSGQWARARRRERADVGDKVMVEVLRENPGTIEFEVNIVNITHRAPRKPAEPARPQSEPLLIEVSKERDKEIKSAASDFMAFLQEKWGSEEEDE